VEAPLKLVCKEPVPKGEGGLLSRIFCTGLIFGTNGPLKPVLMSIFRLVLAAWHLDVVPGKVVSLEFLANFFDRDVSSN
jgi:hypothetical protein